MSRDIEKPLKIKLEQCKALLEGKHMESKHCWCDPTVEIIDGNEVIIHNDSN